MLGLGSLYRNLVFATEGYAHYLAPAFVAKKLAQLPDTSLVGAHIIVTGANQGIGYATAKALFARGATVHMVCRDEARGVAAKKRMEDELDAPRGGTLELHIADLSSLAQTRHLVERYTSSGKPLHALVCNAGVMQHERTYTPEGFEYNFAVNTLTTQVLQAGLRPVLGRTAADENNLKQNVDRKYYTPRVVVVSSAGMLTEPLVVTDLEMRKTARFDGTKQYARGKRHQVALCERWARLEEENVGSERIASGRGYVGFYSMHPGWVETSGVQNALPKFYESMKKKLRSVEQGADTVLFLLLQDAAQLKPGAFYFDRKPVSKHITGGFTKSKPEVVDKLALELDNLATRASVHGEHSQRGFRKSPSAKSLRNSPSGSSLRASNSQSNVENEGTPPKL
jgi:dehydrogenase/reductase SDR family protein 12